jgi:putative membrane protein
VNHKSRLLPAAFALAGIAVITGLVIYFGVGDVVKSLTSVSIWGFAAYIAAQLVITLGLALCWRMLLRSSARGSFLLLVWGRLVRDATGEFLPFSQVGGYIVGARVITLSGVSVPDSIASTIVDITTEFLAQLIFVGVGLSVLAEIAPNNHLLVPVAVGVCIGVIMCVGLIIVQQGGGKIFRMIAQRLAGESGDFHMDRLQTALNTIYRRRVRLALASFFHLVCWFGTATASFIGFHALGVPLSYIDAIAIEAMLHAIMALAFFVPGRVGIQEAAYTILAAIFGVPPEIAISLSLLRRARDFVIAVPVLLAWQGVEAKRLRTTA